jgi:hypothetical protein
MRSTCGVSLTIIAGAAILAVLQVAQPVIIPFVVSGLLFYALDPAVDWMQRWKMPRALGAALILLLALGGIGAGGYALTDDVMSVINRLPQGVRKLSTELRRPSPQPSALDTMQQTAREIDQAAADATASAATPKGVMRVQIDEPPLRLDLPVVRVDGRDRDRRAGGDGGVPHLLPARRRRSVQAQAGEAHRSRAVEQTRDRADPRRISTQIERFLLVRY